MFSLRFSFLRVFVSTFVHRIRWISSAIHRINRYFMRENIYLRIIFTVDGEECHSIYTGKVGYFRKH